MTNTINVIDLPDGGAIVEHEGETVVYTADEIAEMERDYKDAIHRRLKEGFAHVDCSY